MRSKIFASAILLFFSTACSQIPAVSPVMSERVTFTTSDNVTIVGSFTDAGTDRVALLLHMLPATKESWHAFAESLRSQGVSALAIDLRGHGESSQQAGSRLDFIQFTDAEHQASAKDVDAALGWLTQRGFAKQKIAIVGASIGANLMLQTLGYDAELRVGVALSPGASYRGIEPAPFVSAYAPEQQVLFVASRDDVSSAIATEAFAKQTTAGHELILLEHAGHGTAMLDAEPDLQSRILTWLSTTL